jgi:hypothetical protein
MNNDNDTKRFLIHRLKWLGIYMGISFILLYLLPFPYDFVSILGLFVLVNYLRVRRRYGGMERIKDMFRSVSPPIADNNHQHRPLRYYCMSCGKEHNDVTCPNCGSKMKRVD